MAIATTAGIQVRERQRRERRLATTADLIGSVALSHHQDRSPQSFLQGPLRAGSSGVQIGQSGLDGHRHGLLPTLVTSSPEDLRCSRGWIA
jgi:hypothetical protein